MGTKVTGWVPTAVVEYMSKEEISHAKYKKSDLLYFQTIS